MFAISSEPADIILFIGRFHPVINHLPIGLILLIFLFELVSRSARFRHLKPAIRPVLLLAAISAAVASIAGYMLSRAGDYEGNLVTLHMWLGISVAVASFTAYFLKVLAESRKLVPLNVAYLSLLTVTLGTLLLAGYHGGSLTYGRDYLTEYMPQPLRSIAGLPPREIKKVKTIENVEEALIFSDIVHPIVEARCLSCHNQENRKGGLSMQTTADLQMGGKHGPILVAGNSVQSEMVRRITLPLDDEDRMPRGKRPLTEGQIELISWWIDEGASFGVAVGDSEVPENIRGILERWVEPSVKDRGIFVIDIPPPNSKLVKELTDSGFLIWPLAQDSHFLRVVFVRFGDSTFGDAQVKELLPLSPHIAWLDVGGSRITDAALEDIAKFKHLTRLHLEQTKITDQGLGQLAALEYLEYLNLYGTHISDTGLESISRLNSLKSVYLWQTRVTDKGVALLKEKLPSLRIDTGTGSAEKDISVLPSDR